MEVWAVWNVRLCGGGRVGGREDEVVGLAFIEWVLRV